MDVLLAFLRDSSVQGDSARVCGVRRASRCQSRSRSRGSQGVSAEKRSVEGVGGCAVGLSVGAGRVTVLS